MNFYTFDFIIFFIIFFILYWFITKRNLKIQNLLLLVGCYVFYAFWDWRFLFLLAGSSLINYSLGIYIEKTKSDKQRKRLVLLGLIQGIGLNQARLIFFFVY